MQQLIYAANDGSTGYEYYVRDGSDTVPVGDLNPGSASSFRFNDGFAQIGGKFLVAADDGSAGEEPYLSDGSADGTARLLDINLGAGDSRPQGFVRLGDSVVFEADDGASGRELWITDGTAQGTELLRDINPGAAGAAFPPGGVFQPLDGQVLFAADDGVGGSELWATDGTELGTRELADIDPGAASSFPGSLDAGGDNVLDGAAFFAADDGSDGRELWRTDGTPSGTEQVSDINPGSSGSNPDFFRKLGDRLLFTALDPVNGNELRTTDGTDAGTQLLRDIDPGGGGSAPYGIGTIGDSLVFAADRPSTGRELWATDGTPSGTAQLRDIWAGASSGLPFRTSEDDFGQLGERILFAANDGTTGFELYATDGTTAGTGLLADIRPGSAGSNPSDFEQVGDRLYFAADDGSAGRELWVTDGTEDGTRAVEDLDPGVDSSSPNLLGVYDAPAEPTPGDDRLSYKAGEQTIDGGEGTDAIAYPAERSGIAESVQEDGSVAVTYRGETDTLRNVEFLQLEDGTFSYTLPESPETREELAYVYRLYKSSVARTPDYEGLEFWYDGLVEGRQTRETLAEAFVGSEEFASNYDDSLSDRQFVAQYYENVLDRSADEDGLDFWTGRFEEGASEARLLQAFAVSEEFRRANADNYDDGVWTGPVDTGDLPDDPMTM